jgi:thymidylate synthase
MLKEYLWFISGSHNINDLDRMGSRVWDYWRDDQFTMENDFPSGSIGYGYGFNLIHYGGDIRNVGSDPGFNQLEYVIDLLKNDPASRRIYDYTADDFELEDYKPLDKQNVPIAI